MRRSRSSRVQPNLDGTQFNAFLRVEDAEARLAAGTDVISQCEDNARLIFAPRQAGIFLVVATSAHGQETGGYTLMIREFARPLATNGGSSQSPQP